MKSQLKPRYQHIKDLIIEQISKGELRPHDRVPSENELVESTGVSRMTANRALRELSDEGYVDRVAGKGTFVSDLKANSHVLEVRNIADEVTHRGHAHSAHIIQRRRRPADEEIARALNIPAGTEVFNILLVHQEDGTPIQVEDRYVKTEFAPEFLEQDFTTITPSAYLSNISPLQEADHVVRAAMPDPEKRPPADGGDGFYHQPSHPRDEPCWLIRTSALRRKPIIVVKTTENRESRACCVHLRV